MPKIQGKDLWDRVGKKIRGEVPGRLIRATKKVTTRERAAVCVQPGKGDSGSWHC